MKVLVAQSCPILCNTTYYSPPGFSVHGILQVRILERVAITLSRGSSRPRNQTWVSCIAGRFFIVWATREVLESEQKYVLKKTSKRWWVRPDAQWLEKVLIHWFRACSNMKEKYKGLVTSIPKKPKNSMTLSCGNWPESLTDTVSEYEGYEWVLKIHFS